MCLWSAARLSWGLLVKDGLSWDTWPIQLCVSLILHQPSLFTIWAPDRAPWEQVEMQGHLRPWLDIDILSLTLHSFGQSKSQGQPRFKERGNRLHVLMELLQSGISEGTNTGKIVVFAVYHTIIFFFQYFSGYKSKLYLLENFKIYNIFNRY